MALIHKHDTVAEGADFIVMMRITGLDNANIVQADVSSAAFSVFNVTTTGSETTVVDGTALTVATVVKDTLQTDARWTKDATGYNFIHTVPASAVPDGSSLYQIEYTLTMADGTTLRPDPIGVETQPWFTD